MAISYDNTAGVVAWDWHRAHGGGLTVATFEKRTRLELGVLETDAADRVVRFVEKPTLAHKVSMGVYVLSRAVVDLIPDGAPSASTSSWRRCSGAATS